MRVISGRAKGTGLFSPQGKSVRPTSDYVKENLFNMIGDEVRGARFLDGFAGSGAVGIEALSRGASFAVFVDSSQKAIDLVKRNLEKTRLGGDARVIKGEIHSVVKKFDEERFDIIFLDPPYFEDYALGVLDAVMEAGILDEHGQIIIEAGADTHTPHHPALEVFKEKVYGNSKLVFLEGKGL